MRTIAEIEAETERIHGHIQKVMELFEADSKWNINNMDLAIHKLTTEVEPKYPRIRSTMYRRNIEVKNEKKRIRKVLYQYYEGRLNKNPEMLKLIGKGAMQFILQKKEIETYYIPADELYQAIDALDVAYEAFMIELDGVIKTIGGRGYHFKNIMDDMKFKAGIG